MIHEGQGNTFQVILRGVESALILAMPYVMFIYLVGFKIMKKRSIVIPWLISILVGLLLDVIILSVAEYVTYVS
jgi:hypothetical protein